MLFASVLRAWKLKKFRKMSGVSKDAPIGIQCLQYLSGKLCPRLQINRLRWYQASVLILTYFTYMTYHLTRKPISVVKNVLHQNCSELPRPPDVRPDDDQWCNWAPFNTADANTLLGTLDSAFLFSYAGAMFISGMVAERVDLRYFLTFGMLLSSLFCYLFGIGRVANIHYISYYLLVSAGAGIAQTSGWPGTVASVGRWFGSGKKGLIFGIWNSHTSLGNILGTVIAAAYVEDDWALSFIYPALCMAGAAAAVWLFLVPEPRCVGLAADGRADRTPVRESHKSDDEEDPPLTDGEASQVIVGDQAASLRPNRHSANAPPQFPDEADESTALLSRSHTSSASSAVSLSRALRIPGVVEFSLSLFFAKLVSYTFLYWLPMYIKYSTHMSAASCGFLSTVFDVGGALGAVAAGLLADWSAAPALTCAGFYLAAAPALLAYQQWGAVSHAANLALLVTAGALVNAPYALITTAVSAELGTHSSLQGNSQALATVTAIIDGTGSVGAALGPMLAGVVSSSGSWAHVFHMLIACDCFALLLLLRIVKTEIVKIRSERRLASPRAVRIE